VPDDSQPPVAIRISRPYATEDEFLEHELETLSRTSVTLLGAQPRPQGVVLRFELVLSQGNVLMRGEGRVVGFRPNAHQGLGGLTLRFTRLDSRSKALVDRAAAVRERRRPSMSPSSSASLTPPASPSSERMEEPAPSVPFGVRTSEPPLPPEATPPAPPPAKPFERPSLPPASAPQAAPGRDEVLARLRARAQSLEATAVQSILEQRKRQA
jgi:hypothetical protein